MDGDLSQLDRLAARLRATQTTLGAETAKDAAPLVETVARATAAAGTTPNGEAWTPKKKGSGAPLQHVAGAITCVAGGLGGAILVLVLRGKYVHHHLGDGHLPKRQILPSRATGVPAAIKDAIRAGARSALKRVMGGS